MRIAKPMLMVSTPVGLIGGLYEGYQLAGGLVFLMLAMLLPITAAFAGIALTIRRERARAADAENPQ